MRAESLFVVFNLVGQVVCARALFAGVGEHADVVEQALFHEIAQLVEVVFGFAGESCDERGTQRGARHHVANMLHELLVFLARTLTVHGLQDARLHVLQRDIEVVADVVVAGNGCQQLVSDALRLDIHDAEPGIGKLVG